MFQKKIVKSGSIIAIILSVIGLLLSVLGAIFIDDGFHTFAFVMGIITWIFLLWASVIGYQLCTSYNLYDDEYKKVGIRIYAVIIAFNLFFFVGYIAGFGVAVIIFSTLWGLKRNYDEWNSKHPIKNEGAAGDNN